MPAVSVLRVAPRLALLASLAVPGRAAAQVIMGRLVDATSRAPLAGVMVRVEVPSDSAVTMRSAEDGAFSLLLPAAGRYQVKIFVTAESPVVSDTIDLAADAVVQREFLVARPAAPALFEFQVDRPVRPISGVVGPRYPEALRSARVEGDVLAQWVVDSTGRVEAGSLKVLKATSPEFVASVRDVVYAMRYQPAEVGGRRVRQLVQQPFEFRLSDGPPPPGSQPTRLISPRP
jgi:TonB family protein